MFFVLLLFLIIFPQQTFARKNDHPKFKRERNEFKSTIEPNLSPSPTPLTPTSIQTIDPTPSPQFNPKTSYYGIPEEIVFATPTPTPASTPTLTPTPSVSAFDLTGYEAKENLTIQQKRDWKIIEYLLSTIIQSVFLQIGTIRIFV